jgi:hypothetical protein
VHASKATVIATMTALKTVVRRFMFLTPGEGQGGRQPPLLWQRLVRIEVLVNHETRN